MISCLERVVPLQLKPFYYFDETPDSAQVKSLHDQENKNEANDQKIPRKIRTVASFDTTSDIAKNFLSWLTGSGGGCKCDQQVLKVSQILLRRRRGAHV